MKQNGTIKLFVDAHVFDNEHQGSRTFLKELYNHLVSKKDIEFYFGAHNIENLKTNFPVAENIHFTAYKNKRSTARLLFDIPRIIKQYNIQYAHFQYIVPLQKTCYFIVTTHDVLFNDYPKDFPWWYRFTKNLLYKMGAKKADLLTTVSSHSKKSIQKYLGIPADQIHVLPNGINQKYFIDYNKETAATYVATNFGCKKYILFSSRIEPRKNHVALLQVYLDLALYADDYQLVFIGHQSIKVPALDQLLQSVSPAIRQKIILLHDINDEALFAFYKAATVFVYPSKAEGFGFPPLEAAALKIPVLCSNNAALSDFTFFSKNHIDISDYCLFKKRLLDIIQQKEENSLQAIAHTIKQKYDWEKTTESFYRLLKNHHTL